MNKWVRVEDMTPPSGKNIMLYSRSSGVSEGEYSAKTSVFIQYRWSAIIQPTHWKPMDEPPQDIKKGE